MYSVVLMLSLSGGADAVEFGRHRNGGCGGCDGGAPVVVGCTGGEAVGCTGGEGCNGGGCNGGGCHGGGLFSRLFHRNRGCHGCNGGAPEPAPCCPAPAPEPVGCTGGEGCNGGGCHGHGLFRGGLFRRHRNRGCNGCEGGAGCNGGEVIVVPAGCNGGAPAAGCVGGAASAPVSTQPVAMGGAYAAPVRAIRVSNPIVVQPYMAARR